MLTERQLEYVVAAAETGTFTAAAERCHVAAAGRFGAGNNARLGARPNARRRRRKPGEPYPPPSLQAGRRCTRAAFGVHVTGIPGAISWGPDER
jgi:hypothetical protein